MKAYLIKLGQSHYKDAWEVQKIIHNYKLKHKFPDIIISTEHYPVYTLGKTGERNHLLINEAELKKNNIDYFEIDRGGDITYHGPGQLVVYPIFNLGNFYKDTHRFLRDLEEAVILTLSKFGIDGTKDEEFTGVWVGNEKICAIGIKVSRWVTMHGLALNVNNELSYFDKIIPCGIFHKGVTSISKVLDTKSDINTVHEHLINSLNIVFGLETETVALEEILRKISINSPAN